MRVALAAGAFLAVWVMVNREMFRRAMIANGDVATILLQVHDAKHFHELLGNYSRWHFHHPGPGFMYVLALGDGGLRDLLHVVPAPLNAAALTLLALYTCCLFGSIWIFQQHCDSPLFLPAAVGASLWFLYVVDRTFPGSASGGVWMPYVLMFSFLLFLTACASLADGNARHLPLVTLSGMFLIHGHVAQAMFAGVLATAAVATWFVPLARERGPGVVLKYYRRPLLISAGIAALLALPMLLELGVHSPNNLQNILAYGHAHRGPQNSWLNSVKYVASFVTFTAKPEEILLNPKAHLIARAMALPYVVGYWTLFLFLSAAAAGAWWKCGARISRFLQYVLFELGATVILVVFWARHIAGGLFNFNAYFFFATFLLASFVLLAFVLGQGSLARSSGWTLLVACLLPLAMLAAPYQYAALQDPDQEREARMHARIAGMVANLPGGSEKLRITWPQEGDWPTAAGVASWLQDRHRYFCVQDTWGFMFGQRHVCPALEGLDTLAIVRLPHACEAPCRRIFQDQEVAAEITPAAPSVLPFTLKTDDPASLTTGFYEPEGEHGPMWSMHQGSVHFVLAKDWHATPLVRVKITGVVLAGRPVASSLNGHPLGTSELPGLVSAEFKVPQSYFRSGAENELQFQVDRAAPVEKDPRTLGFQVHQIEFLPEP